MSEQVFADGIGPIVVVGGTVRLDFVTLVPDDGEAGSRPKPVVQHRLFMPTEAFLVTAKRFAEAAEAISKLERERGAPEVAAAQPPMPQPPTPQPPTPQPTAAPQAPAAPIAEPPAPSEPPPERPKPPFP
jgi:Predicted membrane protein